MCPSVTWQAVQAKSICCLTFQGMRHDFEGSARSDCDHRGSNMAVGQIRQEGKWNYHSTCAAGLPKSCDVSAHGRRVLCGHCTGIMEWGDRANSWNGSNLHVYTANL